MEIHEAADLFPMAEDQLKDLADDIKRHGQKVPIELFEGKILDGRRRWRACEMAKVAPRTIDVSPQDPVAYVLSLNLHRRHLTPSQLSMVAARARAIYDRQARERMESGVNQYSPPANLPGGCKSDARDAAGKAVGVSGKSVDHATKVLTKGVPELVAAVEEGRMAVSTAAILAHETEEEQRDRVNKAARTYKPVSGGGTAHAPKRHVVQNGQVYDGLRYAGMAIEQLKRIKEDDPTREEALSRVEEWIARNRSAKNT